MLADAAPAFGPAASGHIGGPTAQFADVQDTLAADFQKVGLITVFGILLVLIVLLRAIVAPLYLVATVLISYGSTLGISAFLFQEVLGQPGISPYLPLMVFVLLVALGSDYNIFLMHRVREEAETRPMRDAVRIASGHTGSVITSAGLILAGTFGSMATASLMILFQVGVAVAIGVLIDTFLVRSILVPAITTLVGDWAWWPSGRRSRAVVTAAAPRRPGVPVAATAAALPVLAPEAAPDASSAGTRSRRRLAIAVGLVVLVPVLVAGLLTWSFGSASGNLASVQAAVVNLDEGGSVPAVDGSTQLIALGSDLTDALTTGDDGGFTWVSEDAAGAESGLANGSYAAVLTIPADFSRTVAAIRTDPSGTAPKAALRVSTDDGSGYALGTVARAVTAAIGTTTSQDVTASYVDDVLVRISSAMTRSRTRRQAPDRSPTTAARSPTMPAASASWRTPSAPGSGSSRTAPRRPRTGRPSSSPAPASSRPAPASLADGAAVARDRRPRRLRRRGVAGQRRGLARGRPRHARGPDRGPARPGRPARRRRLGRRDRRRGRGDGRAAARRRPGRDGGPDRRPRGLGRRAQRRRGLARVRGTRPARHRGRRGGGRGRLSPTRPIPLPRVSASYTADVSALAADCLTLGGSAAVCDQLTTLAADGGALTASADGVASGAAGTQAGTAGVADGMNGIVAGADGVHDGTQPLAASLGGLETGIADVADGATDLASGATDLSAGADQLAGGTQQLADGMPALAAGIAKAADGGDSLADGATSLAGGIDRLADGTSALAEWRAPDRGRRRPPRGRDRERGRGHRAAHRRDGRGRRRRCPCRRAGRRPRRRRRLARGWRLGPRVRARDVGGRPLVLRPDDAGPDRRPRCEPGLGRCHARQPGLGRREWLRPGVHGHRRLAGCARRIPGAARHVAARRRPPVVARRRCAAFGGASAIAIGGTVLMVIVLDLLLGVSVASPGMLLVFAVLASLAFTAVVQALVATFGTRGWLAGLLLLVLGIAASGIGMDAATVPGPLAAIRPLLPLTAATDAFRGAVVGAGGSLAIDAIVLSRLARGGRPRDARRSRGRRPGPGRRAEASAPERPVPRQLVTR